MAGAFAAGFQMGGNAYNQAERMRLEQAAEDRRATEFAQAQEDRTRLVGLRDQEDVLRNQLTRPNLENYALAPAGGQSGLGFRAPAAAPAALPEGTGLTMPQLGMPTGGEPTFRPTATMGLEAPAPSTRQPTFNAAPTGADAEQLLGRMALLKGDTAAYRASQDAARGFRYADTYKNARQSWDSMSDEDRAALINKASYDVNIPGHGTWVAGTGNKEGYMNFMPPGKDPVKLSNADAREVFAISQAMEIDPMKARTELDKASDKVRAVLKDSFESLTKGVTQNNLTTYHVNDLAEKGRHNKATEANQAQQLADGRNANKLSNVQLGMERDPNTGQLRQVMVGLQFNQKTSSFDEVRQPLTNNMIPMSAFDPKTMAPAVEALIGRPIDPTNKNKDAPKHNEATARQAVVDSIANQYLGAGKNPLSPENAASAIRERAKNTPAQPAATPAAAPVVTPVNLGVDPNRSRPGVSSVTGQPYFTPPSAPNVVAAVGEGLDTAKANYVAYLKTKIANNQPLTADENMQAMRFKLK